MAILVSRQEVMDNLLRFQKELRETAKRGERTPNIRRYQAIVNRATGELKFGKSRLEEGQWENIEIDVKGEGKQLSFALCEKVAKPLQQRNLAPLAWRILHETEEALNHIAAKALIVQREALPEEAALRDLSDVQVASMQKEMESLPSWQGRIDRFASERLLHQKTIGTYLLRYGDEVTGAIASQLEISNHMRIAPYLCTVVEPEEKISDILILETEKGWTFYRDNPDLTDSEYHYFSSADELMDHLRDRAWMAL